MPPRKKQQRHKKKNDFSEVKSPFRGRPDKLENGAPVEFTADDGTLWIQDVQIREQEHASPMSKVDFVWKWLTSGCVKSKEEPNPALGDTPHDEENGYEVKRTQYTVKSREKPLSMIRFLHSFIEREDVTYIPNRLYVNYVNWTFTASFFTLFLSFLAIFMLMIFLFGVILMLAGLMNPNCVSIGGDPFDKSTAKLADAFHLSWTTFTTVGYGVHATASGIQEPDHNQCTFVVFLCTTESLVGLLYAGMCAAIFFGRVARVQSHAQVTFSEGVCVEYGDLKNKLADNPDQEIYECPTLKFQLINQLANSPKGEIMDATLKCVASNSIGFSESTRFVKVELKEFEHPFFKRVWHGRHTLNQYSHLLTPEARTKIALKQGWPAEWRDPETLRNCLNFKELIVTLTGISNISASTVHAYKTYQFGDLLVGYEFAPLLYKHRGSSRLKVDMRLVDDVVVQNNLGYGLTVRNRGLQEEDISDSLHFTVSKFSTPRKKTTSSLSNLSE